MTKTLSSRNCSFSAKLSSFNGFWVYSKGFWVPSGSLWALIRKLLSPTIVQPLWGDLVVKTLGAYRLHLFTIRRLLGLLERLLGSSGLHSKCFWGLMEDLLGVDSQSSGFYSCSGPLHPIPFKDAPPSSVRGLLGSIRRASGFIRKASGVYSNGFWIGLLGHAGALRPFLF